MWCTVLKAVMMPPRRLDKSSIPMSSVITGNTRTRLVRACEDTVEGHTWDTGDSAFEANCSQILHRFLMESCSKGLKEEGPRSELVIEKAALEKVRRGEGSVHCSERSRAR